MKAIYKLSADCGRMGTLFGIFVAHSEHVEFLVKEKITIYFGEVLGKHSDIYGEIEENEITKVSEDPNQVKMFEELNLSCGYNPLEYPTGHSCSEKYGLTDCETSGKMIEKILKKKEMKQ